MDREQLRLTYNTDDWLSDLVASRGAFAAGALLVAAFLPFVAMDVALVGWVGLPLIASLAMTAGGGIRAEAPPLRAVNRVGRVAWIASAVASVAVALALTDGPFGEQPVVATALACMAVAALSVLVGVRIAARTINSTTTAAAATIGTVLLLATTVVTLAMLAAGVWLPASAWQATLAASGGALLLVDRVAAARARNLPTRVLAVLVGIDNYGHPRDNLSHEVERIEAVGDVLLRRDFAIPGDVAVLTDRAATRMAVGLQLDRACRRLAPRETLLFVFAGHGNRGPVLDGLVHEPDRRNDLLYVRSRTRRTTWLSEDDIGHRLALADPQANIVCVFDSCYSGGMATLTRFHPRVLVIASASEDQVAYTQHSIVDALRRALERGGADTDRDGAIDTSELCAHMQAALDDIDMATTASPRHRTQRGMVVRQSIGDAAPLLTRHAPPLDPLPAVSLRQPHAEAAIRGLAVVPGISPIAERGRMYIYAPQSTDDDEPDWRRRYGMGTAGWLARGKVIGSAVLDVIEGDTWQFSQPERLPVPVEPNGRAAAWFWPFGRPDAADGGDD